MRTTNTIRTEAPVVVIVRELASIRRRALDLSSAVVTQPRDTSAAQSREIAARMTAVMAQIADALSEIDPPSDKAI